MRKMIVIVTLLVSLAPLSAVGAERGRVDAEGISAQNLSDWRAGAASHAEYKKDLMKAATDQKIREMEAAKRIDPTGQIGAAGGPVQAEIDQMKRDRDDMGNQMRQQKAEMEHQRRQMQSEIDLQRSQMEADKNNQWLRDQQQNQRGY